MPASEGGITETFAHQLPNDDTEGMWRSGKVCLVDVAPGRTLAAVRDEPHDAAERLHWHLRRTVGWLWRASHNELLSLGEPFELPVFGQWKAGRPLIAFVEDAASFEAWSGSTDEAGLAQLAKIGANEPCIYAVMWWETLAKRPIATAAWGTRIAAAATTEAAIFLRFPRLPVRPPWRAPQTWGELRGIAAEQGLDFDAALTRATSAIRDGKSHFVLVGFPISRVMGEAPSRMYWTAFRLPALTRAKAAKTAIKGFRTTTAAPLFDRLYGALADEAPVPWCRTENWDAGEISARGRFEDGLAGLRIALLGAGALGAAMAPLLVRAGASDLAILDAGELEAGNLARHELGVHELGHSKAEALAERLNALSPTARVAGFAVAFPPAPGPARDALDRADLVIDATTSDEVIEALAAYPWPSEPSFASVSFSFSAEHLYLYLASGPAFPAADFEAAIAPWLDAHARPLEYFPTRASAAGARCSRPERTTSPCSPRSPSARSTTGSPRRLRSLCSPCMGATRTGRCRCAPRRRPRRGREAPVPRDRRLGGRRVGGRGSRRMVALCRNSGRLETGGILIGRYGDYRDRVIVSRITGPPRDSRRFPANFIRGITGLARRLRGDWRDGQYYVGEWHFHPYHSPNPSPTDRGQIKAFAADPSLACPRPVLIVVGGNPWDGPRLWVGVFGATGLVELLEVEGPAISFEGAAAS